LITKRKKKRKVILGFQILPSVVLSFWVWFEIQLLRQARNKLIFTWAAYLASCFSIAIKAHIPDVVCLFPALVTGVNRFDFGH